MRSDPCFTRFFDHFGQFQTVSARHFHTGLTTGKHRCYLQCSFRAIRHF